MNMNVMTSLYTAIEERVGNVKRPSHVSCYSGEQSCSQQCLLLVSECPLFDRYVIQVFKDFIAEGYRANNFITEGCRVNKYP
jgi:hypothetical protein